MRLASLALLLKQAGSQAVSARSAAAAMATTVDAVKPLLFKTPTPADIDIAQACAVKHITQIAEGAGGLGLLPDEYELYGPSKAKVWCARALAAVARALGALCARKEGGGAGGGGARAR